MIPEEEKEEKKREQKKYDKEYQERRNNMLRSEERRPEWKEKESRTKEDQYRANEKSDNRNYLTIWDLPTDINKKELEYICRKIEKAQIVRIKRSKYKALAVD